MLLLAPTPQKMKITGRLSKLAVVVLVDSRSTRNFLDPNTAHKAGLSVIKEGRFEVAVENGERIPYLGRCDNVKVKSSKSPNLG